MLLEHANDHTKSQAPLERGGVCNRVSAESVTAWSLGWSQAPLERGGVCNQEDIHVISITGVGCLKPLWNGVGSATSKLRVPNPVL